ncbi:hypothetical protein [Treponema succinifaciens]|uniref:Uncharacterized protein n=1 Tax=Treponema succinifaciens (strain ATCC 33096 / DSM 2489 / 6091) TaxID=869209 RepID=F2NTE3_TRES6|nr:hypothetical protein [Treponema succinifaciens]AEB14866.1 hypothetical protein Tresu_1992 [Treponema succinifaciens DSM 2489]
MALNNTNNTGANWGKSPNKCYLLCPNCKEVVMSYHTNSGSRDIIDCPKCKQQIKAKKAVSYGMFEVVNNPDDRVALFIPEIYLT